MIGLGAVGLAILAWRAFIDSVQARKEAEAQGWRAQGLEEAVATRTRELSDANDRLREEAASAPPPKRNCARSRRWRQSAS